MNVGEVVAFVGALFMLLAAIGVLRFRDVLDRMHALSKAATLGIVLVLGGAALTLSRPNDWTTLVLAMILQLVTSPVSSNLISRSIYRTRAAPSAAD
jgi:multicomponent Na+:H+ antiporter subunit G